MNTFFRATKLGGEVIYKNNHVANIYEACTCCYDNTKYLTYIEKKEYIKKRVDAGHESILEHGRLALKIKDIENANLIAQLTTLEYSRYLEFYSIHKEDEKYNLIINGNMRAYKHFITNTILNDYLNNRLIRIIHSLLIENTVGELYGTEFKMYNNNPEHTDTIKFVDIETLNYRDLNQYQNQIDKPSVGINYDTVITDKIVDNKTTSDDNVKKISMGIDVYYIDNLIKDPDINDEMFLNIVAVTVLFKNISRTATHQLVRHRNAITQESQRYVNYKDATFTIPVPEYDSDKKYNITLFGQSKEVNLSELAIELMSVYEQLTKAGLKKEEARAYLPSNVNCRRLYMTFTLHNLIAFLKLRTDSHAQFEIRSYANVIKETLLSTLEIFGIDLEIDF